MSEKHLMLCNLIAWKEGNDYVFEDGSKAYKFTDNNRRFSNCNLYPEWVVNGLTGTPFRRFGFKDNKIHVQYLGVFTRSEFEREIVKYKEDKLKEYIGKTIRLLDGNVAKITELRNYKFIVNIKGGKRYAWVHTKDMLSGRYVLYSFGMETVASTGEICERVEVDNNYDDAFIIYVKLNGEIVQKPAGFLFRNTSKSPCFATPDDIVPITSAYMYENRIFYYKGFRQCKITGDAVVSNPTFDIEFLDNGEKSRHSVSVLFKYAEANNIVRGRWVDAEILERYYIPETKLIYYVLRFCDGSTTCLGRDFIRNGTICHSDVLDACKGTGIKVLGYWYDDGKWYVRSSLGVTTREAFKSRIEEFKHFLETCIGKTYVSVDGYKYVVESFIMVSQVRKLTIVFDNGKTKSAKVYDVFNGNVSMCKGRETLVNEYKDWTESTMGLRFRAVRAVGKIKYEIEFENGDRAVVGRVRLLNRNVYPNFIEWVKGYTRYIGDYRGYTILSVYFDFSMDVYVLLTRERNLLYVERDGSLRKVIKNSE